MGGGRAPISGILAGESARYSVQERCQGRESAKTDAKDRQKIALRESAKQGQQSGRELLLLRRAHKFTQLVGLSVRRAAAERGIAAAFKCLSYSYDGALEVHTQTGVSSREIHQ